MTTQQLSYTPGVEAFTYLENQVGEEYQQMVSHIRAEIQVPVDIGNLAMGVT